ncbi:MAG: winged helix-turn-helix domain-containing protein [Tepidisphaerales bacterium]
MADADSLDVQQADVRSAFELLLEELEATVSEITRLAHEALDARDYVRVSTLCTQSQRVTEFRGKVVGLLREWESLTRVETVSTADRGHNRTTRQLAQGRLERGTRTPQEAYVVPILQAVVDLGGSAPIGKVLDRVFEIVKPRLRDVDLQPVPSSPDVSRWRNAAQWARQEMVDRGLLSSDSPRGIWEITEAGRAYLAERRTSQAVTPTRNGSE